MLISVPITNWPLQLTPRLSQPALDTFAHRVGRGEPVRCPVRAGFFVVQKAEISSLSNGTPHQSVPLLTLGYFRTAAHPLLGFGVGRGVVRNIACHSSPHSSRRNDILSLTTLRGRWFQFDQDLD